MPELWLRKTFPGTTFAEDSTDVFKCNMLERCRDMPGSKLNG